MRRVKCKMKTTVDESFILELITSKPLFFLLFILETASRPDSQA